MGAEGLETVPETREKQATGQKLTPNAPPSSPVDAELAKLIESWPSLSAETRVQIFSILKQGRGV